MFDEVRHARAEQKAEHPGVWRHQELRATHPPGRAMCSGASRLWAFLPERVNTPLRTAQQSVAGQLAKLMLRPGRSAE